jgi:hypothetical protein
MEAIGFDLRAEASISALTADVVKSSAIEGEFLDPEEVRSSIARRLGLDVAGLPIASRDVEGVVETMLDATQNFASDLTSERLFGWHAALFPTGRSGMSRIAVGRWRPPEAGAMQVVSGPFGREKVHFEAPTADRLEEEMARFLEWFNAPPPLDPVLGAGVAHFWFVTIHPFEDGNGRTDEVNGRVLHELSETIGRSDPDQRAAVRASTQGQQRETARRWHMNRDTVVLLVLLGIPAAVGLLSGGYLLLARRASAFACPACGKPIAKQEMTAAGVACPHCNWRVASTHPGVHGRADNSSEDTL